MKDKSLAKRKRVTHGWRRIWSPFPFPNHGGYDLVLPLAIETWLFSWCCSRSCLYFCQAKPWVSAKNQRLCEHSSLYITVGVVFNLLQERLAQHRSGGEHSWLAASSELPWNPCKSISQLETADPPTRLIIKEKGKSLMALYFPKDVCPLMGWDSSLGTCSWNSDLHRDWSGPSYVC